VAPLVRATGTLTMTPGAAALFVTRAGVLLVEATGAG